MTIMTNAVLGDIPLLCWCLHRRENFQQVEIWIRENATHEEIISYFAEKGKGK